MKWTMEALFSSATTMDEIPSKTRNEEESTFQSAANNSLSYSTGFYIVEYVLKNYKMEFLQLQQQKQAPSWFLL
jgi:hypothetical protein